MTTKRQQRKLRRSQGRLKILGLVLVGSGLLLFGVIGLILLPGSKSNASSSGSAASVVPVKVSFPSPALNLVELGGREASLEAYRGQVVLVNNWATWCPPCRAEMPTLEGYYQDHKDDNFSLIGIEAGDPDVEVEQFVDQYALSFPVWLDPENKSLSGFQNSSLPSSYVIDRDGTVVLAWTGAISREMLEKYVTPLIKD